MKTSVCTACAAPIRWARSIHSRPVPLNARPDSLRGNVRLDGDLAFVLAGEELDAARRAGTPLYLSHFVSCPAADAFRKRLKGGG